MPDLVTLLLLAGGVAAAAALDLLLLGDAGPTAMILSLFQRRGDFAIGAEALVGAEAVVLDGFGPSEGGRRGAVRLRGERWTAVLEEGCRRPARGAPVEVVSASGLVLVVRPRDAGASPGERS